MEQNPEHPTETECQQQIDRLCHAFDGNEVTGYEGGGEAGEAGAASKLEQGTLKNTFDSIDEVGTHCYSGKSPNIEKPLSEVLTEERPCDPCWMNVFTVMHDDVEAIMSYQENDTFRPKPKPDQPKKKREKGAAKPENIRRSARRAKKKMRQTAMMLKSDTMLTLTTAYPVTDWDQLVEIMKNFRSAMQTTRAKRGKSYEYIAVPEKHDSENTSELKRGSYHVHVALTGRYEYSDIWECWRKAVAKVLGEDQRQKCSCQVNNRTARVNKGSRPYRIATYLSKYMAKSFEDDSNFNKKRYWASRGIEKPIKIVLYSKAGKGAQAAFLGYIQRLCGKDHVRQFDSSQLEDTETSPFLWAATY